MDNRIETIILSAIDIIDFLTFTHNFKLNNQVIMTYI